MAGASSVLIVDDDPFIRKLVATTLEDVSGFKLLEASDGREAVELVARDCPSLVFLDVDMPNLNGFEACRRIRAQPGCGKRVTIVMLTATAGGAAEREAEEAGADLFLTKPFSPLELLRLVSDLGHR